MSKKILVLRSRGRPGPGVTDGNKGEIVISGNGTVWNITETLRTFLRARSSHTGEQPIATVTGLQTALDGKAAVASPAFTGTPTAPTQPAGDASTLIATTAHVQTKINLLISDNPGNLATLNAIKALLDTDPSVSAALTTGLTLKADKATTITGTGLAVATGNLGAAPAIAVPKASAADVAAGTRDDAAMTPAGAAGRPIVSADWTWLRTDASGRILEGIRHDGALVSGVYTHAQGLWPASLAMTDEDGAPLFARNRFGVDLESAEYDAWIASGQIHALVNGDAVQMTGGATVYAKAEIRGGQFVIVRSDNRRFVSPLSGSYPALPAAVTTIEYSDGYGQSNMVGSAANGVINGAAFNDRFLMFEGGQRAFSNALGNNGGRYELLQPVVDATHNVVRGFEQMAGTSGETCSSGFAHEVLRANDIGAAAALMTSVSAVGGVNMEMLWRAATENPDPLKNEIGDIWRNLETKFVRACLFWRMNGFRFVAGPLRFNQGEGNINRTKANHLSALQTIRDDWQALAAAWNALRTSGGHANKAPLIVAQTVNGNFYNFVTSQVPWAQLQINLDDPTTALCAGPVYDQAFVADGVHLSPAGQEMQGARMAVAYNAWLRGELWRPLAVRSDAGFQPTRTGTTVRLRIWNHFNLPLTFDTATITGLGADQGFRWRDDGNGNAVTVTGAAIVDNTTVDLTLSAVPTGTGGAIDIGMTGTPAASAGPSTGNRATLRTNGSGITTRTGGRAVEHFICIDRVNVV